MKGILVFWMVYLAWLESYDVIPLKAVKGHKILLILLSMEVMMAWFMTCEGRWEWDDISSFKTQEKEKKNWLSQFKESKIKILKTESGRHGILTLFVRKTKEVVVAWPCGVVCGGSAICQPNPKQFILPLSNSIRFCQTGIQEKKWYL